jgi:hypothetical protein
MLSQDENKIAPPNNKKDKKVHLSGRKDRDIFWVNDGPSFCCMAKTVLISSKRK